MRVTTRTFASLRELSAGRTELELPGDARVTDAWEALAARHPGLVPHRSFVRAARNGAYAGWDDHLTDGDEVAFLPPVSGGAQPLELVGLTDAPIDVSALETALAGPGDGALITFVGRARNRAGDGREVVELEYEVYPEMAEAVLRQIAEEAERRFGAGVAVVHRTGVVPIGQGAVAIVTSAAHRGVAYDANRYVIEEIKQRLPIWKRERFADGTEWKQPGV